MSMYKRPELDLINPPGQIVNDVTLGDYITRKQQQVAFEDVAQEKKLTFDEWWSQYAPRHFSIDEANSVKVYYKHGWEIGQENK